MKINISKGVRQSLQAITILLSLLFGFLILIEHQTRKVVEEKYPVYTYKNKGVINYEVFLKPNMLFSEASIEEGGIYITEFVDHIASTFVYEFSAEDPAYLQGDYEIIVTVEGYSKNSGSNQDMLNQNTTKTIWKKDFVMVPKTVFQAKAKTYQISEDVLLDYNEYSSFAKQVAETTKLSIESRLHATMNIHLKADTGAGIIEEQLIQSITIPFGTASFEIYQHEIGEKTGSIEESRQTQIPPDSKKIFMFGLVSFLMLAAFLFFTFFTQGFDLDEHVYCLKKIIKKHGSRLVAVNTQVDTGHEKLCIVKSIDDLVKLADEVGKPILYRYSPDPLDIDQFLICDDPWLYAYSLKDEISGRKQERQTRSDQEKTDHLCRNSTGEINNETKSVQKKKGQIRGHSPKSS